MREIIKLEVYKLSDGSLIANETEALKKQKILDLVKVLEDCPLGVATDDGYCDVDIDDVHDFLENNREFIIEYLT